ncbi:hypothetical protein ACKI1Q_42720 [Streptomyces galilaeus]
MRADADASAVSARAARHAHDEVLLASPSSGTSWTSTPARMGGGPGVATTMPGGGDAGGEPIQESFTLVGDGHVIAEARHRAAGFLTRVQAEHGIPVSARSMDLPQLVVSGLVARAGTDGAAHRRGPRLSACLWSGIGFTLPEWGALGQTGWVPVPGAGSRLPGTRYPHQQGVSVPWVRCDAQARAGQRLAVPQQLPLRCRPLTDRACHQERRSVLSAIHGEPVFPVAELSASGLP